MLCCAVVKGTKWKPTTTPIRESQVQGFRKWLETQDESLKHALGLKFMPT
jgi:hypothetical protein